MLPHVSDGHAAVRKRVRTLRRARLRRRVGEGPDLRLQGEGEDASLHPRPDQLEPGSALHQPVIGGLQELRKLDCGPPERAASKPPSLGINRLF